MFGEHPRKPTVQNAWFGSNSETQGRSWDGLGSNIVVQYSVGPIITLHGRITAREFVDRLGNQVHPMIQTLFPNNDAVFQDGTQLELFSHGLKSMTVNFNIFPGQHNHHVCTSMNHCGQFRRLKSEKQIPTSNISKAT
jgi:hypothetical protein